MNKSNHSLYSRVLHGRRAHADTANPAMLANLFAAILRFLNANVPFSNRQELGYFISTFFIIIISLIFHLYDFNLLSYLFHITSIYLD
jgi:hypothetical protein